MSTQTTKSRRGWFRKALSIPERIRDLEAGCRRTGG